MRGLPYAKQEGRTTGSDLIMGELWLEASHRVLDSCRDLSLPVTKETSIRSNLHLLVLQHLLSH